MKIIHLKGYSEDELYNYRPTIFKNLLECARALISAMRQLEIESDIKENRAHADFLLDYTVESSPHTQLDPRVGEAILAIWNDPVKELLMDRQSEFYLMDSAE